jgi:hypothetical protein
MKTQMRALAHVSVLASAMALGLFCAAPGFAQTAPAKAVNAASPVAAAPAKAAAPDTKATMGGGAGKVWVNASSKTYHCEGSKFYGKTKTGEYMSEADAKSKGNHAVKGKACAK